MSDVRVSSIPTVKVTFDYILMFFVFSLFSGCMLNPITRSLDKHLEFDKEKFSYECRQDEKERKHRERMMDELNTIKESLEYDSGN